MSIYSFQSWWRSVVEQQRYRQLQQRQQEERQRQPQRRDFKYFSQFVDDIVLIQACWRRWLALRAYRSIKRGDMPLCTLRRFLHLLDIGQVNDDFE
jgi:hypothetical protein